MRKGSVEIIPQEGGWLLLKSDDIVLNIHPQVVDGKAGELKEKALDVFGIVKELEREGKDEGDNTGVARGRDEAGRVRGEGD